jgi:RNA binding exosome subunit
MGSIHHIALRAIAQATEDVDRVKAALSLILFDDEIETIDTEGHNGNPITILQARLKGRDCNRFIELLKSKLPEHEIERLRNERCERIDEDCTLHIRFDKQAAYKGTIQLATTTDTIAAEIKIRAYPAKREKAIEAAKEIF